jgi:hypothetical protein
MPVSSYLNFYREVETGKIFSMFARDETGAKWERQAVLDGWWGYNKQGRNVVVPAYVVKMTPKKTKRLDVYGDVELDHFAAAEKLCN